MRYNSKLILALSITLPSTLAAVNGSCTGRNGVCLSTAKCNENGGQIFTGKCPNDPTNIKCCDNIPCSSGGKSGICMNTSQCTDGEIVSNLCPGGKNFKCCIPKKETCNYDGESGICVKGNDCKTGNTVSGICKGSNEICCLPKPVEPKCSYQGLEGVCRSVDKCNGFNVSGLCPGGNDIKCCLPRNPCEDNGVKGQCIPTDQCGTGNIVAGKCPGGKDIKCCLPKPLEPKCSYDGLDGVCKSASQCNGFSLSGLCQGGGDIQCCLPKYSCEKNGKTGQCLPTKQCGTGNIATGLCPGGKDIRCCLPQEQNAIKCTADDGTVGTCMNVNNCSTGNIVSGKCPGNADIKCCLPKPVEPKCSYEGINGSCKDVKDCTNGFNVSGLCPGGSNIKCCLPKYTCESGGLKGKCLPVDQCGTGNLVSNKCPGGKDIKCCLSSTPPPPGPKPDNSSLAAAAVSFAWETKEMGENNEGTELYRAVKDAVYPGDWIYQSCDRGVATAVAWSGADDNFPVGDTATQDSYLQRSSNNNKLWMFVGKYDQHYTELKPGDILVTTAKRRSEARGKTMNHGHIVMYVGKEEVQKKYPNSDAEFVSASYEDRSPGCGDHPKDYIGDGYYLYRYIGNYSGSKKYAYTGTASGISLK